jgi:hypothetical protein
MGRYNTRKRRERPRFSRFSKVWVLRKRPKLAVLTGRRGGGRKCPLIDLGGHLGTQVMLLRVESDVGALMG